MSTMQIWLKNINDDIDTYNYKEVTVTNTYIPNTTQPHPDGLFSEEIFGRIGTKERKTRWGYISLHDTFMSPHAFYVLQSLKRNIALDLKEGLGRYYVDKTGEITKLEEGKFVPDDALYKIAGTGFDWLQDAWDSISWKVLPSMTNSAKTNRKWFRLVKKEEVFIDKILVMPAFYRDISYTSSGSTKKSVINTHYSKILRLAEVLKNTMNFVFTDDPKISVKSTTYGKMQDAIMEIYLEMIPKLGGANGFINENVVGKTVDFGARMVISAADYNTEHYTQNEADFFHTSIPLATAINIFSPFSIYGLNQWIKNFVSGARQITYWDKDKKQIVTKELDPSYLDEFTPKNIRKFLDIYKSSKRFRLRPMTIRATDKSRIPLTAYIKTQNNEVIFELSNNVSEFIEVTGRDFRELTYVELLYIIAETYLSDKTVLITRYPLTTYNNTYTSLMNIIPATKYTTVWFNGTKYTRYPIPNAKTGTEIEQLFVDSLRLDIPFLGALGGDFDGDQVSVQPVFTKEAIEDGKRHMNDVKNIIGISGESIRTIPAVVKHGLFNITYRIPKPN